MRILATGSATPAKVLTNEQLATMVDTSDEWIHSRTGIKTRHIAVQETTLTLARDAAQQALRRAAIAPERIGVILCATVTHEIRCPSLACCLQRDLGLRREILAFDLNAACSGFIYALICAAKLMREGDCALVVGSEVLSRFTDFSNRSTCVLFGDAAAAAVVAPSAEPLHWTSEAHGDDETLFIREHIGMNGPAVFRFAVEALVNNIQNCTAQAQLTPAQIDLYICHQANQRIIASAAKKLGLPLKRFFLNLARFGNTSAASIPLALDEAACTRVLRPGMRLVMAGFGGGLTAGAICLTWGDSD